MSYVEALVACQNAARKIAVARPIDAHDQTWAGNGLVAVPQTLLRQLYAALDAVDAVCAAAEQAGSRRRLCREPNCWRQGELPGGLCYFHSAWARS